MRGYPERLAGRYAGELVATWDRLRGHGRVLAFRTYGLDILDRLRAAGFEARLERVDAVDHAITDGKVVVGRKRA